MIAFFAVGTFWFWALLTVAFVAITCLSEEAAPGWATAVAIATGVLLQWFGGVPILTWLRHNPKEFILLLIGYLLAGVLYALAKWTSFIKKKAKKDFVSASKRSFDSSAPTPPSIDEHSDRIIGWMAFWPCNAAWTLFDDPIRWAFETIFEKTKGLFQRIADRAYQKVASQQK